MMLNTKLRRTSLAFLAVVLMLSVFAMTAFAEETVAADIIAGADANDAIDVEAPAAEDEGKLEVENSAAGTEEETQNTETTGAADDHEGHDHAEEAEDKEFTTSDLVLLIIFGVAVIAAVIVCIIKREKVGKFLRSLKSEFKKIVWSPWNQVKKNAIVVIVVVIVLAIVIGVLDFLFGHGITELKNLINPAA